MDKTSSPTESCAKEIISEFVPDDKAWQYTDEVTAIIQRLLSSEVAKVHGEYQKLAAQWRDEIKEMETCGGYLRDDIDELANRASEVEALAPNKEI